MINYIPDNNGNLVKVLIKDIVSEVENLIKSLTQEYWVQWYLTEDGEVPEKNEYGNYPVEVIGNCYIPVRLQVVDGAYYFRYGDPSFDQDHRGTWGSTLVYYGMSKRAIYKVAKELIKEMVF